MAEIFSILSSAIPLIVDAAKESAARGAGMMTGANSSKSGFMSPIVARTGPTGQTYIRADEVADREPFTTPEEWTERNRMPDYGDGKPAVAESTGDKPKRKPRGIY